MNNTPIDKTLFDAAMATGAEKLWGLPEIARVLGVSIDKARRIANRADAPIYKPDGERYFAFRSELNAWLRARR